MPKGVVIVFDERDAEIARAARSTLEADGCAVSMAAHGVTAETLDPTFFEDLDRAGAVVVIVREGGRGNRLLRAAEDRAKEGITVLPFVAETSPDHEVSARTAARIRALRSTVSTLTGGRSPRPPVGLRKIAVLLGALALVTVIVAVALVIWLPPSTGGGRDLGGREVVVTGTMSSIGWLVTFHVRDPVAELWYKRPSDPDYVSTGVNRAPSAGTNEPTARTMVTLADLEGRVPFLVRYRTPDGREKGPYEVVFDTTEQAVASVKDRLVMVPEWVSFRRFDKKRLCYFSSLLSDKYALSAINYGIDTDTPSFRLPFSPSNKPGIANDDQIYLELPADASFVTVEIVFLDGTSQRKRFPVRDE